MAAVLDSFPSKLADILMGMAKEEVEMLLGVPGEITKLETTLGDISSILGDAERRRIRDSAVERWVRELKDVMYDADDILDPCQIMEGGEDPSSLGVVPKRTSGWCKIPKMCFCFRNPIAVHEIGRKIGSDLAQSLTAGSRQSVRVLLLGMLVFRPIRTADLLAVRRSSNVYRMEGGRHSETVSLQQLMQRGLSAPREAISKKTDAH
ncbi:unnamed protein product [Urochloa humidicola]